MRASEGKARRRRPVRPWLGLLLGLVAGCAVDRQQLDQALQAHQTSAAAPPAGPTTYHVACPDVLELAVAGRPQWPGPCRVDPDGCIKLEGYGRVRIEGMTLDAVTRTVADFCGVRPEAVRVSVAEYRSQQLFLAGQVAGLPRAVPYQGSETVLDLLRRVGGVTPGAALDEVYVVRGRVAEGKPPEVFRVDLHAILLRNDPSTNVSLQPFDQVFIGETRQWCVEKCLPPWLKPAYEALCGMRRLQIANCKLQIAK
jgi:protein involved in polysaccharide export with SLBB domain